MTWIVSQRNMLLQSREVPNVLSLAGIFMLCSTLAFMGVVTLSGMAGDDINSSNAVTAYALTVTLPFLALALHLVPQAGPATLHEAARSLRPSQCDTWDQMERERELVILMALHSTGKLTDGEYAREKTLIVRWTLTGSHSWSAVGGPEK